MQYKNIHLIYFSPTHTSAKISYAIAEGLEAETLSESDITCEGLKEPLLIGENELVIVAAPVYGGPCCRNGDGAYPYVPGKEYTGHSCSRLWES